MLLIISLRIWINTQQIEKEFGSAVRKVVAECTDDKSLPKAERKRLQIVNTPHKSDEAKLVKMADKVFLFYPPVGRFGQSAETDVTILDLQLARPE